MKYIIIILLGFVFMTQSLFSQSHESINKQKSYSIEGKNVTKQEWDLFLKKLKVIEGTAGVGRSGTPSCGGSYYYAKARKGKKKYLINSNWTNNSRIDEDIYTHHSITEVKEVIYQKDILDLPNVP